MTKQESFTVFGKDKYANQIKLTIGGEKQTSAMTPIRWCFGEKMRKRLSKVIHNQKKTNFQIMIVAIHESGVQVRRIAPIDRFMDYITFPKPGKWQIYARVVWDRYSNDSRYLNVFLEKAGDLHYRSGLDMYSPVFRKYMLSFTFQRLSLSFKREHRIAVLGSGAAEVMVPAEFFAKEPSKFVRWLADTMHAYPSRDECEVRRRLMELPLKMAYVLVLLLTYGLVRWVGMLGVLALSMLLGLRNINFKPFLHPLSGRDYPIKSVFPDKFSNIFEETAAGESRMGILSFFTPIVPLTCLLAATVISLFFHRFSDLPFFPLVLGIFAGGFTLLIGCYSLFKLLAFSLNPVFINFVTLKDKISAKAWGRIEKIESDWEESYIKGKLEAIDDLACVEGSRARWDEIPRHNLVVTLLAAKAAVCKPFAR